MSINHTGGARALKESCRTSRDTTLETTVCPACGGKGGACTTCGGSGKVVKQPGPVRGTR
jgi:hypothetical protein